MRRVKDSGSHQSGGNFPARLLLLTALTMTAFAANSILCRLALRTTAIDPATFTLIRLICGAATLWLIVRFRNGRNVHAGNWTAAFSLFAYAGAFSFAYVSLSAGTGALILFGAVQATMILYGLLRGERLTSLQTGGLALAIGGLLALLLPGATAPHLGGAALMTVAGIAWGAYSLLGRGNTQPIETTSGNFLRASVFGGLLETRMHRRVRVGSARCGAGRIVGSGGVGARLRDLVHGAARVACHPGGHRAAERAGHCGARRCAAAR